MPLPGRVSVLLLLAPSVVISYRLKTTIAAIHLDNLSGPWHCCDGLLASYLRYKLLSHFDLLVYALAGAGELQQFKQRDDYNGDQKAGDEDD